MKKIIIAALAATAIGILLVARRNKNIPPANVNPFIRRPGNEKKHITNVFSKTKKNEVQNA